MVSLAPLYFFPLNHCPIAVPVVVVFTKCDALSGIAFGDLLLKERQLPQEKKIKEYVKEMLNNSTWKRLKAMKHPPKAYVYLESKSRDIVML